MVFDLPTALYITAAEIEGSTITGQFAGDEATGTAGDHLGMLFEKGNPLVTCVNEAVAALEADGTLADLEQQWLSDAANVPVLK